MQVRVGAFNQEKTQVLNLRKGSFEALLFTVSLLQPRLSQAHVTQPIDPCANSFKEFFAHIPPGECCMHNTRFLPVNCGICANEWQFTSIRQINKL